MVAEWRPTDSFCQLQWTVRQQSAIPIVLDCTSTSSLPYRSIVLCASRILAEFGLAATEDSSTGGDPFFFFLP